MPGVTGLVLQLAGLVSVYCHWVRQQMPGFTGSVLQLTDLVSVYCYWVR